MAKKVSTKPALEKLAPARPAKSSALVDTRVVYCGDNLEQLKKLPDACVALIYIDPPFNSTAITKSFGARPRRSAHLKTGTNPPAPILTT